MPRPPTVRQIYALAAELCERAGEEFPESFESASETIERLRIENGTRAPASTAASRSSSTGGTRGGRGERREGYHPNEMPGTSTSVAAPTRELLAWVASRPRTYGETMEAWRTHCPRLSVWDDAVIDGLVRVAGRNVLLTARGQALLEGESGLGGTPA